MNKKQPVKAAFHKAGFTCRKSKRSTDIVFVLLFTHLAMQSIDRFANVLANSPVLDAVVECLIEKGVLTPPEDGIGAEGCWMSVKK